MAARGLAALLCAVSCHGLEPAHAGVLAPAEPSDALSMSDSTEVDANASNDVAMPMLMSPHEQHATTQLEQGSNASLSVPIACLASEYMLNFTNLTLDSVATMLALPECVTAKAVGEAKRTALTSLLDELQGHPTCSSAKLVKVELFTLGWGATMHGLIKPLMHTLQNNQTMLTPVMEDWTGNLTCPSRSLDCFMLRLAPEECDSSNATLSDTLRIWPSTDKPAIQRIWGSQSVGKNPYVMIEQQYQIHGDSIIPETFRAMGWFWWTTQLQKFLWRPSSYLTQQLATYRSKTGLSGARSAGHVVLGLHVRQGDACADGGRTGRACSSLNDYMVEVDKMRARSGVSHIYLASDSDSVFNATLNFPNYTWIYMDEGLALQKSLFAQDPTAQSWDSVLTDNIASGKTDVNEKVARLSSIDMMLLGESDLFVGKFSSNFFRTAYELKAAECNCAPAFASLDSPWCFDYGAATGIAAGGGKFSC